jgi:hypothetical protein
MLGKPGDIEADILGKPHHVACILDDASDTTRVVAQAHEVEYAEVHFRTLISSWMLCGQAMK